MEARPAEQLPRGGDWLFEPKWDGFRCLAFRDDATIALQSKSGQSLTRYFPEVVEALHKLGPRRWVLDGEIVIARDGAPDFDALLQRIHPAKSRVARLAVETPASYQVFDLLARGRESLLEKCLRDRRAALEDFAAAFSHSGSIHLSPATTDRAAAEAWLRELAAIGLDGVVAKKLEVAYLSGSREGMVKVKRSRTADCVIGGFRWAQTGKSVGSLLLGLYDEKGSLDHVGFCSAFSAKERRDLEPLLLPRIAAPGFTGRAPGGPSRWSAGRSTEWEPLRPDLVCEVRYDHFTGGRFRHGTKFLRWRPDKAPEQCTFDQISGGQRRRP
jgi:ATP-dependent DNA ligase